MFKKKKVSASKRPPIPDKKRSRKPRQKKEPVFVPNHRPAPSSGICLLLSTILFAVTLVIFIRGPFEIREYDIETDTHYTTETIGELLGDLHGKNYLSLDKEDLSASVTEALPYVRGLDFEYRFPFKMKITAVAKKVSYYCKRDDGIYILTDDLCAVEQLSIEASPEQYSSYVPLLLPKELTFEKNGKIKFESSLTDKDIISLTQEIAKTRDGSVVSSVDFSDPYNIKYILNDKYLICFGDLSDKDKKLKDITDIFEQCAPKMFEDRTLRIDVSVVELPTYTFDISIKH